MVGLRRALVRGLAALLFLALLTGAYAASLNHTLGKPDAVESSLRNSSVYDQIAKYAITRATESTSTPTGSVSLKDPKVKAIATSVFSKQLVQQNAETFINSNYRWLQGETETPSFTLDLSASKLSFANQVNQTVFDYLSKLPVCTPAQLTQLLSAPIDPLTITCRPTAVVPKAEADRVKEQIMSSDFLAQPVLTAETLKINGQADQGKPYYISLSRAPKAFQLLQITPLILGLVAIVLALAVIFLTPGRKGVRRVGLTFAFAGLVLVATKFVSDTLFNRLQAKAFAGTTGTTDVQKPLIDAAHQLEKQIVTTDLYIGVAFVAIGLLLIAIYFKLRSEIKVVPPSPTNRPEPKTPTAANDKPRVPVPTPKSSITMPGKLRLAQPPKGPAMDITRPSKQKPQPGATPVKSPANPETTGTDSAKKQQPRPRRRLIQ